MTPETPKYVAPTPDPGLEVLKAQNEQQQGLAIQDRVSAASARLMTTYGARVATAGDTNWSPLISAPPAAPQTRGPRYSTAMTGGAI